MNHYRKQRWIDVDSGLKYGLKSTRQRLKIFSFVVQKRAPALHSEQTRESIALPAYSRQMIGTCGSIPSK